jgi:hypothetical protein
MFVGVWNDAWMPPCASKRVSMSAKGMPIPHVNHIRPGRRKLALGMDGLWYPEANDPLQRPLDR